MFACKQALDPQLSLSLSLSFKEKGQHHIQL